MGLGVVLFEVSKLTSKLQVREDVEREWVAGEGRGKKARES